MSDRLPLLSAEAIAVVRLLDKGGQLLQAGVSGKIFVVFRRGAIVSSGIRPEVTHEIERAGLLTEGRRLAQHARAWKILERLRLR